jgi:hypothetical protein
LKDSGFKVLVACHVHDSVTPAFCQSYAMALANLTAMGIPFGAALFKDSDVSRGRNQAAAAMLENDYSHLMFVDADIEFEASDILALLNTHRDVVVGPYRKKNEKQEYNFEFVPHEEGKVAVCSATGAVEVMRAGTGFMLIRRTVFEQMREAMPDIHYQEMGKDGAWRKLAAFFEFQIRDTPYGRQQFSEDFNFCERWRALGGTIWMQPGLKLHHWGSQVWRGDLSEVFEGVQDGR